MQYGERNWTEIPDLTDLVVVVPLGSLEQHGRHLPLLTDSMIGDEIVRRAEDALGDSAVFLPILWAGASDHHRRFPGTVSLRNDTYTRVLVDVLESLIGSGFKRILMLNAHGGNVMPGQTALYEVQMRYRDQDDLWLAFATWYTVAAPQIADLDILDQKRISHASELETSMILSLRPELVRMDAARGASTPAPSDVRLASRISVVRAFERLSETGALGHPERATVEKGQVLFDVAVKEVVACVREVATWEPFAPG
jgi:creatinine amidohydrolase